MTPATPEPPPHDDRAHARGPIAPFGHLHGEHAAPDDGGWDHVGAARWPSRDAFVGVWLDPRMVQAGVHRRAGTRRHRLVVTRSSY